MKLTGEKILKLPKERVWEALNDPEILRRSIPGCESFELLSEDSYRAVVTAKIGPVQARFNGTVRISDRNPPHGYTLSGEGSGGAAGGAKGSAKIILEEAEEGTRLAWDADAQISGKLAQIGSRLVVSSTNMMAGQFFNRFEQALSADMDGDETDLDAIQANPFFPSWLRIAGWGGLLLIIILLLIFA